MTWQDFPKVELHTHLEGCASPAFVRGLAAEKGLDISGVFDERGHYRYADFDAFLKVYEAATEALKTPEDYRRLTQSVLEDFAEHNVVYAETFVSPDFMGGGDVGAFREYLAAMEEAKVDGVTLRGIITCIRHFGPEKSRAPAVCAAETKGDFIVGFGMAGGELVGRPGDYAWAFDCAREAGLPLTCHAGEWGGAAMVRDTVADLGVNRIGHGVHAIQDPTLVEELVEKDIVLEVCPGSNVALGVYPSFAAHPIAKLRDAGVKVTVSTDDPPFFHTTMTREFEELERAFGWGADDFSALNQTALDAAYCDDVTKAIIAERLAI